MIPKDFSEFRAALLDHLNRVAFESEIKILLGTMETPVFLHPYFGEVFAESKWLASVDFDNVTFFVTELIGLELLRLDKNGYTEQQLIDKKWVTTKEIRPVTEYHFWIYQVPTPDLNYPCIRYARQVR